MHRSTRQAAVKASEKIKLAVQELNRGEAVYERNLFSFDNFGRVEVKESSIPGSGKGVFALCDFSRGDVLVEYIGEVVSQGDGCREDQRYDLTLPWCKNYVLRGVRLGSPQLASKKQPQFFFGSLVNSAFKSIFSRNAEYQAIDPGRGKAPRHKNLDPNNLCAQNPSGRLFVVATKDILKGEEIFTHYDWTKWEQ